MRNVCVALLVIAAGVGAVAQQQPRSTGCDPDNGGLTLPQGFCAQVVADNLGPTRHLAVSPRGDVYTVLAARGGPFGPPPSGPPENAVIALPDANGDGKLEQVQKSGP